MQECTDSLLKDVRAEFRCRNGCTCGGGGSRGRLTVVMVGRGRRGWAGDERASVLGDDIAIVFFTSAAKELEEDDEEDDANARAGEHAFGGDVP